MTDNRYPLRFTVIIPLEFHRGQVETCLRRWAIEQSYPRDQYEIIAAGCRFSMDQQALSAIKAELGPHDRLLLYDEPHDIALNAHAAGVAKGEILVFTESHCLPEPNALYLANEILQSHPDWSGFSGSTMRATHNRLSVVEADMYEADIEYGMQQHPWRKLLDQIFVVREERYHAAGGFRLELGHFAEWHLAARLHEKGYQIGYAPAVQVKHYYVGDVHELIEFSADFAHGEMLYHSEFTNDPARSYFQPPIEWLDRHSWIPRFARTAFRLGWQVHSKNISAILLPREIIGRCRLLLGWGFRAYFGPAPEVFRAALRFRAALWILRLVLLMRMSRGTLLPAFLRLIDATVRLERIRFIDHWREQMAAQDGSEPAIASASSLWLPDNSNTFRSVGFHAVEEWKGQQFRWSEPVGMIEVALLPGIYRFQLEWLPLKGIENLIAYLDEKPIRITREGFMASGVFQVISRRPVRFSWTCEPWTPPRDHRLLGLPVASISWASDVGMRSPIEKNNNMPVPLS
jgi:hypothetical protein